MNGRAELLKRYEMWLRLGEKRPSTISKYLQIAREFMEFMGNCELSKELVIEYKESLKEKHVPAGVNVKIAGANSFLKFLGREDCRVKYIKIQRQMFAKEERELGREEYRKLLRAAKGKRIYYIIRLICSTGIRVSELKYITMNALYAGKTTVNSKNKVRWIFIPKKICRELKAYMKEQQIKAGSIFVNRKGNPLDRTRVWKEMKSLCEIAGVAPEKVFPHNLRHLFARTFYSAEKDIVRLADLLGHSNIQTTRIYTLESGLEHKKGLERVQYILNGI